MLSIFLRNPSFRSVRSSSFETSRCGSRSATLQRVPHLRFFFVPYVHQRQDFKETPDFVGGSYDGYSWAFVDTDIEKFVHQPLRNSTRDLESLATLGPLIESYFRKLAVWSKKKFELVKDEDEVVRFANESVAVKSKGRRTLRLEEIVDEREFFDCIGQVRALLCFFFVLRC